jgi:hypothetical protein
MIFINAIDIFYKKFNFCVKKIIFITFQKKSWIKLILNDKNENFLWKWSFHRKKYEMNEKIQFVMNFLKNSDSRLKKLKKIIFVNQFAINFKKISILWLQLIKLVFKNDFH